MEALPEELILHIVSFIDIPDLVRLQSVSRRFSLLARDQTLWKTRCFDHTSGEALRRLQQLRAVHDPRLAAQDPRLAKLRNAVSALPGRELTAWDVSQLHGSLQPRASADPVNQAKILRVRALTNWEPGYPNETLDYYEEYIHRHAPINIGWLKMPEALSNDKDVITEATGIGTIADQTGRVSNVVAPLDDGSICLWDVAAQSEASPGGGGRIQARSSPGLLSGRPADATSESSAIMTETGAVECVSIDSGANRAYFAVKNLLREIDLATLRLISTKQYPFPITALSQASNNTPITVGTNMTIHLHDPRDPAFGAHESSSLGELIGGSIYSHATLAQPGPLSILHHDGNDHGDSSIWVAGRFTSLLNYDRRFFPRLRGTIHSGARIASLSVLPHPLIPRSLDLVRNPDVSASALLEARCQPGTTMLAAAEYKGKGSLEMYGLPRVQPFQNRQTASSSKLLSVASHGGRIVFSDGDGNIKWLERDGFSHVRTFNINDAREAGKGQASEASTHGIWSSSASEAPGQGDIVQKIVPTAVTASTTSGGPPGRHDINQANLLLWTGDGRIGLLGFGHGNPLDGGAELWEDAVESQTLSAEQRAREDAARQYAGAMRRALERNADEVRFVRGLGMGFTRQ